VPAEGSDAAFCTAVRCPAGTAELGSAQSICNPLSPRLLYIVLPAEVIGLERLAAICKAVSIPGACQRLVWLGSQAAWLWLSLSLFPWRLHRCAALRRLCLAVLC